MFLYGMKLMGNGLKESSSGALKTAMEKVTNNPIKAFLLGVAVTAVIQSSTATIVITSGLVAAGVLNLHQSLGIIIGANGGTTVTGQIIRLLDVQGSGTSWIRIFQPSSLAPIALVIGIITIMAFDKKKKSQAIGAIAIGFGILFSGLMNMTSAVSALSESDMVRNIFMGLGNNPLIGYVAGAGVAFVLQSSSAAVGILQAFSAGGVFVWKGIYAIIVGIYLGDCVTTWIVIAIGAKPDVARVGVVNIIYNLAKSALVLIVVTILHQVGLLNHLWDVTVNSSIIANTNTVFNVACALLLFPFIGFFEKLSRKLVKDEPVQESKYKEKMDGLSPAFFDSPALALRSCYDILSTMFMVARENIERALSLYEKYDESLHDVIAEEETALDEMTDATSKYIIELLPRLSQEDHIAIVNEYYKLVAEFERMGDHAVNLADTAQTLRELKAEFTPEALRELEVFENLIREILDKAELAFTKRDVEAAYAIEPLDEVAQQLISMMKTNHLQRMSEGKCNVLADPSFTNLLSDLKRISALCSNVGVATILRVRPELTDQEHSYYEGMHAGRDENFNQAVEEAYAKYAGQLVRALGGTAEEDSLAVQEAASRLMAKGTT